MFPYALMLVSFVYMKIIGALQKNQPQQTSLGDASSLAELSKGTIMQARRNICGHFGFVQVLPEQFQPPNLPVRYTNTCYG